MFVASLSDAELQALIVALKYWRLQPSGGGVRKGDQRLTSQEADILLAKLESGILTSLPDDITLDLFDR
jgi:hypothetical protein